MKYDLNDPNLNLEKLEDGSVVSQRVLDIIETIRETWQGRVDVSWIPGHERRGAENQFCVIEVFPDGHTEPIFWVKDESEFTGEVLERLFLADNSKGNVLTRMQARNAALRALQKKVEKDKMDQAKDVIAHAIRSPKNWYKLPKDFGGATIKDYGNRI